MSTRVWCGLMPLLLAAPAAAQSYNGLSAAEWVQDLAATDAGKRDRAVAALITMAERAVPATARALDDERDVVREHAAIVLGRIGTVPAKVTERLVALQNDPTPAVAKAARVAVLRLQVDVAQVPRLIEALNGDDRELQFAAAEVLGRLGPAAKDAARPLVELLQRDDPTLDHTDQGVPGTPKWGRNVRAEAALALGTIGPVDRVPSIDALAAAAQKSEASTREAAATALTAFAVDDGKAVGCLLALISDQDASVRRAAATALTKAVDPEHPRLPSVVVLMQMRLRDPDDHVRKLVVQFLGGCGTEAKSAVPDLVHLLRSQDPKTRECAMAALERLGPVAVAAKETLVALVGAGPTETPEWRQALAALAAIAPELRTDIAALDQFLVERDRTQRPADVRRQESIVEALAALGDESAAVRRRALGPIAEQRVVEAIPHLVEWLGDDRDSHERTAAISVLTALDARRTVPRLRVLLDGKRREERTAAAHGLAMFRDEESMPRIAEVLAEGIGVANSDQLTYLGLTCVVELAPKLERIVANRKADWRRRWGATNALGYLRLPSSARVIAALLEEMSADDKLKDADRQQLLAVALRTLARLDAAPYREQFMKHASSVEAEVRQAAMRGLARLGDGDARAELQQFAPLEARILELPDDQRQRLEGIHLRLSQVRGNTLRDVLTRLRALLDMPIELSPNADPQVLDGRFDNYVYLLGYRPSALEVLFAIRFSLFSGGTLEPSFHPDRIELVPGDNAPKQR